MEPTQTKPLHSNFMHNIDFISMAFMFVPLKNNYGSHNFVFIFNFFIVVVEREKSVAMKLALNQYIQMQLFEMNREFGFTR